MKHALTTSALLLTALAAAGSGAAFVEMASIAIDTAGHGVARTEEFAGATALGVLGHKQAAEARAHDALEGGVAYATGAVEQVEACTDCWPGPVSRGVDRTIAFAAATQADAEEFLGASSGAAERQAAGAHAFAEGSAALATDSALAIARMQLGPLRGFYHDLGDCAFHLDPACAAGVAGRIFAL